MNAPNKFLILWQETTLVEKESHFSWKRKTLTRRMHVPELQDQSFLGSAMVVIHKDVTAKAKLSLCFIVAAPDAPKEYGSRQQPITLAGRG